MQRENQCSHFRSRLQFSRQIEKSEGDNQESFVQHGFVTDKSQLETVLGPSRADWFERLTEQRLDWKLSSKPTKSTAFDSPSTPTLSQLFSVNCLKVGNSPKFNYDSPVQFRSSCGQSPVLTPDGWSDWQKPLLGHSPSPRQRGYNTTFGHLSSTGVRSLGVNADDSALSWTNSLATPPRDISDLSVAQDTPSAEHKDLARALFSPGGDRLNTTGDSVQALDSTYEEDVLHLHQTSNLHQLSGDQHKTSSPQILSKDHSTTPQLQQIPKHEYKISTIQFPDSPVIHLTSETEKPCTDKSRSQKTHLSAVKESHENMPNSTAHSLEHQAISECINNAIESKHHIGDENRAKGESSQMKVEVLDNKYKDKQSSAIKLDNDASNSAVSNVGKMSCKTELLENVDSIAGKSSKHLVTKELFTSSDENNSENSEIKRSTNLNSSEISNVAVRGKRVFDEVDQTGNLSEIDESVTSPTFTQKCSRKYFSAKKKSSVEKGHNKGSKQDDQDFNNRTVLPSDRWQNSSVVEALSDFFDSPAAVARKRRRTSLPAGYTFVSNQNSQNSPTVSSDTESQVRCSTPKDRAPSLQSILSTSQKKKTSGLSSGKKVRFSDCVKKYSIHSEFSPILKKKKKERRSDKRRSSNKKVDSLECVEVQGNVAQKASDRKDIVNAAGDYKVTEVEHIASVDETGDFSKRQIKCNSKLKTKTLNQNKTNLTDTLTEELVEKESVKGDAENKEVERKADVGCTDDFSQISPSALNEMCSVADQSGSLRHSEIEEETTINQEKRYNRDKEENHSSESHTEKLKVFTDVSKQISGDSVGVRKKKTPMKFIYPTKHHILDAIPQKIFQFEENSQTERRESLVQPVLVANIVSKDGMGISSPKVSVAPVSRTDKVAKTVSVLPSNSDREVNEGTTEKVNIDIVQDTHNVKVNSNIADKPTKDRKTEFPSPDVQKVSKTSDPTEVAGVDKLKMLQSFDNGSNIDKINQVSIQTAPSLQGFQAASGKSIKLSTESIDRASKLLLDENKDSTGEMSNLKTQFVEEIKGKSQLKKTDTKINHMEYKVNDDDFNDQEMEFSEEWTEDFDIDLESYEKASNDSAIKNETVSNVNDKQLISPDVKIINHNTDYEQMLKMKPSSIDQSKKESTEFSGFKTSSGKGIKCTEEQLKKAESYLNDETDGQSLPKLNDGLTIKNKSCIELQKLDKSETISSSKEHTNFQNVANLGKLGPCPTPTLGGFSTASGKIFQLSDNNMKKASSLFDNISEGFEKTENEMTVTKSCTENKQFLQCQPIKSIVDKSVVENRTLDAYESDFCSEKENKPCHSGSRLNKQELCAPYGGFSTAGGKSLQLSDANLKKASSIFGDISDEFENKEDVNIQIKENKPASSTPPVNKPKIESTEMETVESDVNITKDGYQFNSGKGNNQGFCSTSALEGFSTAGGKSLKLSDANLKKASSIFGDITDELQNDIQTGESPNLRQTVTFKHHLKDKMNSSNKTSNLVETLKMELDSDLKSVPESLDLLTEELLTLKSKNCTDNSKSDKSVSLKTMPKPQASKVVQNKNVPKGFRPFKPVRPSGNLKGISDHSKTKYQESKAKDWGKPMDGSDTKSEIRPNNLHDNIHVKTFSNTYAQEDMLTDKEVIQKTNVINNDNFHIMEQSKTREDTNKTNDECKKVADTSDELETSNELYQGLSQMFADDLEPSFEAEEKSSRQNENVITSDQNLCKETSGFTLASGKAFSISEKSLLTAQKLLSDNNEHNVQNNEKLDKQETVKGKKYRNDRDRNGYESTSMAPTFDCKSLNTSIASLENDSVGRKETVDENETSVSESQAMLVNKKKDVENMTIDSITDKHNTIEEFSSKHDIKVNFAGSSGSCFGFQTASGKKVAVSEKAVSVAKNMLDENIESENKELEINKNERTSNCELDSRKNENAISMKSQEITRQKFSGFQTASGKSFNLSEEALEKGKQTLLDKDSEHIYNTCDKVNVCDIATEDDYIEENNGNQREYIHPAEKALINIGRGAFHTASGKKVDISEKALANAKKTLDDNSVDSSMLKESKVEDFFQTVSGKHVDISENALLKARQTLNSRGDDIKTLALADSFKTASGNALDSTETSLVKAKKIADDNSFKKSNFADSFQTASGKEVNVSDNALAQARQTLSDAHDQSDISESLRQYPTVSSAANRFQTASGNKVNISEEALAIARKSLEDVEGNTEFLAPKSFQTVSESNVTISEKALTFARKSLGDVKCNEKGHCAIGFQTASGNKVPISEKALALAKQSLEDNGNENSFCDRNAFQTASGSRVSVSEKALVSVRKSFDVEGESHKGLCVNSFQTASGNKVGISENALACVRNTLGDVGNNREMCASNTFQTASGSRIKVSENALALARKSLDDVDNDTGFCPRVAFQTTSGSKVDVSEKALACARKSLEDVESNTDFNVANSFQTASGNRVKVSEKALALARKSFEESDADKDVCNSNAFQTASGSKVMISEKALTFARKSLEDDTSGKDFGFGNPFQTASGSKVAISEKALAFARKSLGEDDSDTGVSAIKGFQTASGNNVTVSDSALAFARKSLSDAENDGNSGGSGSLFTTAKGTQVTVSDKALSAARRSLADSDTEGYDLSKDGGVTLKPTVNTFDKHVKHITDDAHENSNSSVIVNSKTSMEEELNNLRLERDKILKNKRSYVSVKSSDKIETEPESGDGSLDACSHGPAKRQKLDDGLEKTFEDMFDRGPLKRKPLKTRPEGTTTDRRHPGFRPFIPVHCHTLQKTKISLDDICKTGTENISKRDPQAVKSTFCTPYRASAATPQVTMETQNKVKVTAPIFRTNIVHQDVSPLKQCYGNSDDNCVNDRMKSEDVDISGEANTNRKDNSKEIGSFVSKEVESNDKNIKTATESDINNLDNGLLKTVSKPVAAVGPCDELDADMDSYSQDEQDVFYCTLVEARRQQEEIIRIKIKIRPMVGRLFEMKETPGRWKLRDLVVKSNTDCFVPQLSPPVCIASALTYKFSLDDNYSKHTAHVLLGDGAFLVPDDAGYAGKEEFYSAFLTLAGVDGKLINDAWLYNHYRWIVWKLAAYEVSIPSLSGRCLTPEMVMLQLKYRYDREIDLAQRSAIRKIFERDDTPCKRMVLCVAGIRYRGGVTKEPANTNANILDGQVTLELTDGWYGIMAQLDVPLSDLVRHGRISVGQKICVSGAELIGSDAACSPLEAPESVMLKICSNSARPCPWDSPLGYQKDPRPLCVPLSGLYGEGGAVGMVDVVIVRKYPILYMEKLAGGGNVFRTGRCEEKARQEYETQRQIDMQKVLRDVETQADKENKNEKPKPTARRKWSRTDVEALYTGQEIYEGLNCAQQPDTFQSYLCDRQMELLYDYQRQIQEEKQAELNARFQSAWQDKQETAPDRNVTPVLKFRVCGCSRRDMDSSTNTLLTVWRPATEISELQEGKRYKIYSLTASSSRSKYTGHSVQLTATKQTKFQLLPLDENFLDNIYEPREVLWVSDIKRRRPAYGELDFVGLIVRVVPAPAMESGKPCDTVYMADCQGAVLTMKIWNGFKSFGEDLFTEGRTLCCSNLMDKSTFRSHHLPNVEAASEFTNLTKTPQNASHRKALERLNAAIKEQAGFLETTQKMLDNFLSGASPYPETNIKTTPVKRPIVDTPRSSRDVNTTPSNPGFPCKTPTSSSHHNSTPKDQKQTDHEDMDVTTNTNPSTPLSDQSQKQKSIYQSKMARLLSYGSPNCLSPINTPVTRGVRKGFKPPAFKK